MFRPIYSLHTELLNNIVKIKNIIASLNEQKFSSVVLAEFEKDSFAVSAFASTSIEGNPLPLTDVKKLLKNKPEHVRDTEKEVLNYNAALEYLDKAISKKTVVDTELVCKIQNIVVDGLLDKKNIGKIRRDAVVVNDPKKRQVAYLPPDAKDVTPLLTSLVDFLKKEENNIDPLILAGIFHKQFVIIHPFMDGNGRTTRLITKYLLARMGLDTFRLFSFENYYNKNVTQYFSKVGVRGDYYDIKDTIDFTDWLIYFTGGIIDELLRVQKLLQTRTTHVRVEKHEKIILDYIKKQGSITKQEYEEITNRARSTQILDFKRMFEKDLIVRVGKGKATYYISKN
jgi:Fic family protein